jgi:hypothetical protein
MTEVDGPAAERKTPGDRPGPTIIAHRVVANLEGDSLDAVRELDEREDFFFLNVNSIPPRAGRG